MQGKLFSKINRFIKINKIIIKEIFSDLITVNNKKMNPHFKFEIMGEGINKIVILGMKNRIL